MRITTVIALLLAGLAMPRVPDVHAEQTAAPERANGFTLPAGPCERALAAIGAETKVAPPPEGLGAAGRVPGLSARTPAGAELCERWSRALAGVAGRSARAASDPSADRTFLCLLALEQQRWDDAWEHWRALSATPPSLAALLPRLVPGLPAASSSADAGMLPAPLADGVVLRPALPPPSQGATRYRVDRRSMRIDGLKIGAATIGMSIAVEVEGVQIEIEHQGGGEARFSVRIPEPAGMEITFEYLDWYRQESLRAPIEVSVRAGEDPHVLYGRFEPRDPILPTKLPEHAPAELERAGLVLAIARDDPERARIEALAASLASGPLAIACTVGTRESGRAGGIVVDLAQAADRERRIAWLCGAVERFVLGAPPR